MQQLSNVTQKVIEGGKKNPAVTGLLTSFSANDPQFVLNFDRERAKALGVSLNQITDALQVYMGSVYVNDFDFNNRAYRVYVQADQQFRSQPRDLRQFYVRSDTGAMVPLDNIVSIKESTNASIISHYNLFRSAEINGSAAPGFSSGQAIHAMEEVAHQALP